MSCHRKNLNSQDFYMKFFWWAHAINNYNTRIDVLLSARYGCKVVVYKKEQPDDSDCFLLVREMGFEPTQYCYHKHLKLARLPFRHSRIIDEKLFFTALFFCCASF